MTKDRLEIVAEWGKSSMMERFPMVALSLLLLPIEEPYQIFQDEKGRYNARRKKKGKMETLCLESDKEIKLWRNSLDLRAVEVLYIYGLGLGFYFQPVKEWLEEKKEHFLVFIEDDLAVIDAYIKAEVPDIFAHSQVYIHYMPNPSEWRSDLALLAKTFPSDRILLTGLKSKASKEKVAELYLYMQRESTLVTVSLAEVLNIDRLFKNLFPNFYQLPHSFFANRFQGRFKNIPAIICGAGPSLSHSIEALKGVEDRALIIAGGSTLAALSHENLIPHIGVAIDPNLTEFERIKEFKPFPSPFIFAPRLFPTVFSLLNGPLGYMRASTEGAMEVWLGKKLNINLSPIGEDLSREALSVTTFALALAHSMGCNPIILVGVDLAFTERQSYAKGVIADASFKEENELASQLVHRKDRQGKPIVTLVKWVMEAAAIDHYAKSHPEISFINSSEGGIGFTEIPYQPLEELFKKEAVISYDLRSLLHAEIEKARFSPSIKQELDLLFDQLLQSLKRMDLILDQMLTQPSQGIQALLEVELQEELAFEPLFQHIECLLEEISQNNLLEKVHHYKKVIHAIIDIIRPLA